MLHFESIRLVIACRCWLFRPKGAIFRNGLLSSRHTYASWLVMAGVDLYRVKELMGHSSIQTTMRYAHLARDNLRNEVERVFW